MDHFVFTSKWNSSVVMKIVFFFLFSEILDHKVCVFQRLRRRKKVYIIGETNGIVNLVPHLFTDYYRAERERGEKKSPDVSLLKYADVFNISFFSRFVLYRCRSHAQLLLFDSIDLWINLFSNKYFIRKIWEAVNGTYVQYNCETYWCWLHEIMRRIGIQSACRNLGKFMENHMRHTFDMRNFENWNAWVKSKYCNIEEINFIGNVFGFFLLDCWRGKETKKYLIREFWFDNC